ncbi:hypothetical protein VP01_10706g1, partial [Puccinia sorghi]
MIGCVPRTFGKPKGGKLQAEEWINLFYIILIPMFFLIMKSDSCNHHEDLDSQLFNLLSLVLICYGQGLEYRLLTGGCTKMWRPEIIPQLGNPWQVPERVTGS